MNRNAIMGGIAAIAFDLFPANAKIVKVEVVSEVRTIATVTSGIVDLGGYSGAFGVGDLITLRFAYDDESGSPSGLYDQDPSINIYRMPDIPFSASMGSFMRTGETDLFSFQLWNNYFVNADIPSVDAYTFDLFRYVVDKESRPFDVGEGRSAEGFYFNAFDFTSQARIDDLLNSDNDILKFGSLSFSYIISNFDSEFSVVALTDVRTVSVASVPELTVWTYSILGFGMVGWGLRRSRITASFRQHNNL